MDLALTSFVMSLGLDAQVLPLGLGLESLALASASDYVSLTPTLVKTSVWRNNKNQQYGGNRCTLWHISDIFLKIKQARLLSNLRTTTHECVHLVTRGHFWSRDKDGGHAPFDPP